MGYAIDVGDLTPPLVVTISDTAAIDTAGGVRLDVLDEAGNLVFTDPAPGVTGSGTSRVVTHTWVAGQTDVAGDYGVQVRTISAGGAVSVYPGDGPIPFTIGVAAPAGYATLAQARAAGATGTDAEVQAAIDAGRRLIDRHCADTFAPTRLTIVSAVRNDGTALLWRTVRAIEAVRMVGGGTIASWRALSSRTPGQVDAVIVGGYGFGDPLIAGAEPWRGGWANLYGQLATGQVEVTGVFGWDAPPPEVVNANAILAAAITTGAAAPATPAGPDTDDEGNVVVVTVGGGTPVTAGQRTTGNAAADAMLTGLVAQRVRLAG